MPSNTTEKLLGALPEPYGRDGVVGDSTGTNRMLAEAFMAYYDDWNTTIEGVELSRFDKTAVGAALDGKMVYVGYSASGSVKSDAAKRLLLGQKKAKLWGAANYDELLGLLVSLTGVDGTAVTVRENMHAYPATDYEPAAIEFLTPSAGLIAAGIAPGDLSSTLTKLASDLGDAVSAGVRVRITLIGGAVYGTDTYDGATTDYGT